MPSFINTNIASLNAQRNLNSSQSALTTSLQRLSSGLRINSAKDDAAGLAIATRFTSQINGTDQAIRNANDGISLAQTAEGSLGEITNNLQRIRELSLQAANSTNSASDRAALDQEVQQRLAEIDRNAAQTNFNGQKILDGSFGSANFQIGANAGETISVALGKDASMRTSAIGAVASTTTAGAIGATASGGTLSTGAITAGNYSVGYAAALDASTSVTPTSLLFASGTSATSSFTLTAANADFSVAGNGLAYGNVTSSGALTQFDFSGTNLAQFNVTSGGTTVGITLDQNYGTVADVANAVQTQLQAVDPNFAASIDGSGKLEIHRTGSTSAVSITSADANAQTALITDNTGTATGQVATTNTTFTIGGHTITLNQDYTSSGAAQLATDLTTQLQAFDPAYNVTSDASNKLTITLNGSSSASGVAISGTDTVANSAGIVDNAGTAGTASGNASFTVDGQAISLTQNFSNVDDLVSNLQGQLDSSAGSGVYSVTNNNGAVKISKVGDTGPGLAITGADAQATSAGFSNAVTGTAGSAEVQGSALSFKVDGKSITLAGDDSAGVSAVASDLQTQLDSAFGSGKYTAAVDGTGVKITNATNGSAAVTISAADTNATAAGFANATGTAGKIGGSVALTDFSITNSAGSAISLNGSYDSVDDLAAEINKSVSGVYAAVSNGKLSLTSSSDLTLGGSDATTLGFAADTVKADAGSLSTANVKTANEALMTVQRVDSALSSVSSLRSTFGAIQNRFESVISNLSSSSENLTASRSRIQDADFAAETASMTRGQILQQAGTAMLAQANSLPNGVLALLRG